MLIARAGSSGVGAGTGALVGTEGAGDPPMIELIMFNQISLFLMLLAPVIIYMAGAVISSLIEFLRKSPTLSHRSSTLIYRNGL